MLDALRRIVAAKLEIAPDTIETRLPDTAAMPQVRATAGSESLQLFAEPLARAAAALRVESQRRAAARLARGARCAPAHAGGLRAGRRHAQPRRSPGWCAREALRRRGARRAAARRRHPAGERSGARACRRAARRDGLRRRCPARGPAARRDAAPAAPRRAAGVGARGGGIRAAGLRRLCRRERLGRRDRGASGRAGRRPRRGGGALGRPARRTRRCCAMRRDVPQSSSKSGGPGHDSLPAPRAGLPKCQSARALSRFPPEPRRRPGRWRGPRRRPPSRPCPSGARRPREKAAAACLRYRPHPPRQ